MSQLRSLGPLPSGFPQPGGAIDQRMAQIVLARNTHPPRPSPKPTSQHEWGVRYEDGIRHIYYGSGHQKGYFYYPSLSMMAEVLKRVEELSHIYSRSADTYDQVDAREERFLNH